MDQLRPALTSKQQPWGLRPSRLVLASLALLFFSLLTACRQPATLTNTFDSDEALARAVLDAFARQDAEALTRLALTKDEFERIVWPTLPASRPEVGMPMDYLWQDTFRKSRAYLSRTLAEFGGKRFDLVRVEFRGETTKHEGYSVSRKTHLVVRDEGQKEERAIRLFGSTIRQSGRSKVYSYIID